MKPSIAAKKEAMTRAKDEVYAREGAPYSEDCNPYKNGTMQHSRFQRRYEKFLPTYHACEARCRELRKAYGLETPSPKSL